MGECLKILIDDAVSRKRLAVARTLLRQYAELLEESMPSAEDGDSWIRNAQKRVEELADQLVSRSDELGTGIQVILIEEIAAQKRAYQDLRAAYIDLQKKSK